MNDPVLHVDYVCPRCLMRLRPPVKREDTVTWVEGRTRHYAHERCYPEGSEGVDNGGTVAAVD